MKKDTYKTIVVFLKDTSKDFGGNITAYFPFEQYNSDKDLKSGYAHVGQHTGVHIDYAKSCKIANQVEYKDLLCEMEGFGYNLEVVKKIHFGNELGWNGINDCVEYYRRPTLGEIKFGHGATHYLTVDKKDFLKADGTVKSRVKIGGLVYTS